LPRVGPQTENRKSDRRRPGVFRSRNQRKQSRRYELSNERFENRAYTTILDTNSYPSWIVFASNYVKRGEVQIFGNRERTNRCIIVCRFNVITFFENFVSRSSTPPPPATSFNRTRSARQLRARNDIHRYHNCTNRYRNYIST